VANLEQRNPRQHHRDGRDDQEQRIEDHQAARQPEEHRCHRERIDRNVLVAAESRRPRHLVQLEQWVVIDDGRCR